MKQKKAGKGKKQRLGNQYERKTKEKFKKVVRSKLSEQWQDLT